MSDSQHCVCIRGLQPGDQAQWLVLWAAYQDFYEVALSDEISHATFERFLDPAEPLFCAVALQDGQLIGLVNYVLHRSTWAVTDYCYLEDLYVAPTVRGTGAGKLLIEWVQDFARQQQCARLYWHTHHTNKRAQRLYNWVAQDSGFIEYRMTV